MPTPEPLSNRSELPAVTADVNLGMKFEVPLMFAEPAGPCAPVNPCGPVAPVSPGVPAAPGSLSFLGVVFRDPVVARIRIVYGNRPLGPDESSRVDVAVMDDFFQALKVR